MPDTSRTKDQVKTHIDRLISERRTEWDARDKKARQLNIRFHSLLGISQPCEKACTHMLGPGWTALGAANVLGRHS